MPQRAARLEDVLRQQNLVTEEELLQAQSQQLGIPFWKTLPDSEFDVMLMRQVPLAFARQHKLVPIRLDEDAVLVAVHDPLDIQPIDDVSALLKAAVEPVLCPEREILGALNRLYDNDPQTAAKFIQNLDDSDMHQLVSFGGASRYSRPRF